MNELIERMLAGDPEAGEIALAFHCAMEPEAFDDLVDAMIEFRDCL